MMNHKRMMMRTTREGERERETADDCVFYSIIGS